jgi:hypothetical protein
MLELVGLLISLIFGSAMLALAFLGLWQFWQMFALFAMPVSHFELLLQAVVAHFFMGLFLLILAHIGISVIERTVLKAK